MIKSNLTNLEINELKQEQFKSAKESGTINNNALYMVPDESESEVIAIKHGGTNANTVEVARQNLGFTYGTEAPSTSPTTGDGSIFFKVCTDEVPLSLTRDEYNELLELIDSI